jgi:adenylosuccinate lyase
MPIGEYNFTSYLSPFTWRYGSETMREIWSEYNKRLGWRQVWVDLAQAECELGLVKPEQVSDLRMHLSDIDILRSLEIEAENQHDLMAELKYFASQSPVGGSILHAGATSMDIEDNADILRLRQAIDILLKKLNSVLSAFAEKIQLWADLTIMGYTHLQPAAPTTLGYRFSLYAQDLFKDWQLLKNIHASLKGKGFKGAVGTAATFADLLGLENFYRFESRMSELLDLKFFNVSSQTYPRKQDYEVLSILAGLGASLHKFGFDMRILQSPAIGEISEPFGFNQVGSSAMPFKRNPIQSEKIDSLARVLAQMPRVAWDNAANSLLERTLDDSANRRSLLAEACLICDELLTVTQKIIIGLVINELAIERNLSIFGPFSATERVLAALVKKGADRQQMHELLRMHSINAWQSMQTGLSNPLVSQIAQDTTLQQYLSQTELLDLMQSQTNTGIAAQTARQLAAQIKEALD